MGRSEKKQAIPLQRDKLGDRLKGREKREGQGASTPNK